MDEREIEIADLECDRIWRLKHPIRVRHLIHENGHRWMPKQREYHELRCGHDKFGVVCNTSEEAVLRIKQLLASEMALYAYRASNGEAHLNVEPQWTWLKENIVPAEYA